MPPANTLAVQSQEKDPFAISATLAITEKATNGRSAAVSDELTPRPPLPRFRCDRCGYGACCRMAPERCPMCGGSTWNFEIRLRSDSDLPIRRDSFL